MLCADPLNNKSNAWCDQAGRILRVSSISSLKCEKDGVRGKGLVIENDIGYVFRYAHLDRKIELHRDTGAYREVREEGGGRDSKGNGEYGDFFIVKSNQVWG